MYDETYLRTGYPIFLRECPHRYNAWFILGAYLFYLSCSKFDIPVSITSWHSALDDCIHEILSWCTHEKVRRVNAGANITGVADVHTFWYSALTEMVSSTVRCILCGPCTLHMDLPITTREQFEWPKNTLIRLDDSDGLLKPVKLAATIDLHLRSLLAMVLGVNVRHWRSTLFIIR